MKILKLLKISVLCCCGLLIINNNTNATVGSSEHDLFLLQKCTDDGNKELLRKIVVNPKSFQHNVVLYNGNINLYYKHYDEDENAYVSIYAYEYNELIDSNFCQNLIKNFQYFATIARPLLEKKLPGDLKTCMDGIVQESFGKKYRVCFDYKHDIYYYDKIINKDNEYGMKTRVIQRFGGDFEKLMAHSNNELVSRIKINKEKWNWEYNRKRRYKIKKKYNKKYIILKMKDTEWKKRNMPPIWFFEDKVIITDNSKVIPNDEDITMYNGGTNTYCYDMKNNEITHYVQRYKTAKHTKPGEIENKFKKLAMELNEKFDLENKMIKKEFDNNYKVQY